MYNVYIYISLLLARNPIGIPGCLGSTSKTNQNNIDPPMSWTLLCYFWELGKAVKGFFTSWPVTPLPEAWCTGVSCSNPWLLSPK